jgi:hypothetical protein
LVPPDKVHQSEGMDALALPKEAIYICPTDVFMDYQVSISDERRECSAFVRRIEDLVGSSLVSTESL